MTQPFEAFTDLGGPVDSDDLAEVERLFRFIFPLDFKRHYLAINGGYPAARRYLFEKDGVIYVVNHFLSIKYGRDGTRFEDVNRDLKIEDNILPKYLVAFADDPGGDFYCFSTREQDAGSIWIYRGEYSDEPDRAVQFLASSLPEFLAGMKVDNEVS